MVVSYHGCPMVSAIRICVGCGEGWVLSRLDQQEDFRDTPEHELNEKRTDGLQGTGLMLFWKDTKSRGWVVTLGWTLV